MTGGGRGRYAYVMSTHPTIVECVWVLRSHRPIFKFCVLGLRPRESLLFPYQFSGQITLATSLRMLL